MEMNGVESKMQEALSALSSKVQRVTVDKGPKLAAADPSDVETLQAQLKDLQRQWRSARRSRDRSAILEYLKAAYLRGRQWQREEISEFALDVCGCGERLLVDSAFRAALLCGVTDAVGCCEVDAKTIEKWGRVLEIADHLDIKERYLKSFIRKRGGINSVLQAYRGRFAPPRRRPLINRRMSGAEVLKCEQFRRSCQLLAKRLMAI